MDRPDEEVGTRGQELLTGRCDVEPEGTEQDCPGDEPGDTVEDRSPGSGLVPEPLEAFPNPSPGGGQRLR
jgi:hypothetical protein